MGVILFFLSVSELFLPSGIQILRDENCRVERITVGIEINPAVKLSRKGKKLFKGSGYNYFYLRDVDSLETLTRLVSLISSDDIFSIKKKNNSTNLLGLVLNNFTGDESPIVSITLGITGKIDEKKIIDLLKVLPDSMISNSTAYYKLGRVIGKHIFYGKENFLANISPDPLSSDFSAFLVFLRLMNNRKLRVRFSPETAPSPYLIYLSKDKVHKLMTKPTRQEIKKATSDVLSWLNNLLLEKNKSKKLVLTASMGIKIGYLNQWIKELKNLKESKVKEIWEDYLISGFVASLDSLFIRKIHEHFPECYIVK